MSSALRKWIRISLFNLWLVAGIGLVLRYKIAFSLPWVDQKYLLHAHSHFAFSGWISQILMSLIIQFLVENGHPNAFSKYRWLLIANLITAYGMLVSFAIQGYALYSIIFSTLSIFISYAFAAYFWRDLREAKFKGSARNWFSAALLFNVLSSIGAFTLAFLMATKQSNQNFYLASIYFFLHFQYNGWFLFACMGLFSYQLHRSGISDAPMKILFWIFFAACIPTYLLSTLWLPLGKWIFTLVAIAAITQCAAWTFFLFKFIPKFSSFGNTLPKIGKTIMILVAVTVTIKISLQALSLFPGLSTIAFGFRPIVVGYLHLVLLGVITLFILGYIISRNYLPLNKPFLAGVIVFVFGIFFNEIILMIQGIGDIYYIIFPHADWYLFSAALILFGGLAILNVGRLFPKTISDRVPG